MSLLIKLGIFEEPLARFYIAEVTCAVDSVHKMGFIHRCVESTESTASIQHHFYNYSSFPGTSSLTTYSSTETAI